jgi:dephospho-CoA kinase
MNFLVAFSGPMGSGKSTISKQVAAQVGGKWTGFGDAVRSIAKERSLVGGREMLQELGAELVAKSPELFCRRVISEASAATDQLLVVDGVRHKSIRDHLAAVSWPRRFCLVYVDAPLELRLDRLKSRDGLSAEKAAALANHSTEIEVENKLRQLADKRVDNFANPALAIEAVISFLQTF